MNIEEDEYTLKEWIYKWISTWMNGWMDEWWMNKWMNEYCMTDMFRKFISYSLTCMSLSYVLALGPEFHRIKVWKIKVKTNIENVFNFIFGWKVTQQCINNMGLPCLSSQVLVTMTDSWKETRWDCSILLLQCSQINKY
jgi:hypothetical protein